MVNDRFAAPAPTPTPTPTEIAAIDGPSSLPNVPYFAQWESADLVADILAGSVPATQDPLWRRSGAESAQEYEFWSRRACGVACLRMALCYWRGDAPAALDLVKECLRAGAYVRRGKAGVDGLLYYPFVAYVSDRWGLTARVHAPLPIHEITDHLHVGALVMASVHPSIRSLDPEPPSRGGHLVLVVGRCDDNLVLHNPSGLPGRSQRFARVAADDFARFYADRGIVLTAPA